MTQASQLLFEAAQGGNARLTGEAVKIKAIECKSCQTLHELHVKLHKTFVTPIDPEDISLLSEHLDHLLDELEAICYRLAAYHLEPVPLMVELSKRTHDAELLDKAFGLLSINESNDEQCSRILALEEETHQLIRGRHFLICGRERSDQGDEEGDLRYFRTRQRLLPRPCKRAAKRLAEECLTAWTRH